MIQKPFDLRNARILFISAVLASVPVAQASAQSMDYGSLERLFNGPVTTSATGSPQRDTDVPVDMTIVTSDEIRRSGARDITGVLRHVPGVDVMQWGSDNSDISIRGYDQPFASGTLVMIDGRQVYADYFGFIPWSTLPVELGAIQQIEVVKGPNAALFGFNAAGGVINIITSNPRYDDTNVLSARIGSQALGEVSGVATLRPNADSVVRISAGYRNNNDFSTAIPLAMMGTPREGNNRASVDVDIVYALGNSVEIGLDASHSHAAQNEISPNLALQASKYETNSIQGRISADTSAGLLQFVAYSNWIGWKGAPSPWLGHFDEKNQVTVVRAEDAFNIGAEHIVRFALDYRHNAVNTTPFAGGEVAYDVMSASAMWNWQIVPSVALTNAVRLDHLALSRTGIVPPGYPYQNADWSRTLDEFNFNSALVWSATANDTVRVILGRGVELPSLVDLGALLIATPYLQVTGVPSLNPTSVTNYEIAWDRDLSVIGGKLQIALFHQDTQNLTSVGGAFIMGTYGPYAAPANVGASHANGVEFTANGTIDGGWRWSLGYRLEAVDDVLLPFAAGGADFVDYARTTPKNLLKAGMGWSDEHWEVDGYINWQSNTTGLHLSGLGTMRVPVGAFANADLRVAYRVTDCATVAFAGQNLLQSQQRQTAGPAVERQWNLTVTFEN